jgi:lysozyme
MLRPQIGRSEVERILARVGAIPGGDSGAFKPGRLALLGIRGYYMDSMGERGKNDRGIYDDAIVAAFVRLGKVEKIWAFNANTDPSIHRKAIAVLRPGSWRYQIGIHGLAKPKSQQYRALVQAGAVTVDRDGIGADTGWFGINIHRGGETTTSSLGCQTIHPAQWDEFMRIVEAKRGKVTDSATREVTDQELIRYELVTEEFRRRLS